MTTHLNGPVEGMTACGVAAEAVGPTLWFATPAPERCPDCKAYEVEGQVLVIGTLELKIVADSRKQFADVITRITDDPRAHISGWIESYYHTNRPPPRGKRTIEAIEAVADNLWTIAADNRQDPPPQATTADPELST